MVDDTESDLLRTTYWSCLVTKNDHSQAMEQNTRRRQARYVGINKQQ